LQCEIISEIISYAKLISRLYFDWNSLQSSWQALTTLYSCITVYLQNGWQWLLYDEWHHRYPVYSVACGTGSQISAKSVSPVSAGVFVAQGNCVQCTCTWWPKK